MNKYFSLRVLSGYLKKAFLRQRGKGSSFYVTVTSCVNKGLTLLALFVLIEHNAFAVSSLSTGDLLTFDSLHDQHGHAFEQNPATQLVMFARGMKTKDLVSEGIASIDTACLTQGVVLYVADTSKMPRLIAKMVALPRMREYDYPVWLDQDGVETTSLPTREGQVTLIFVNRGQVTDILYSKDVELLSRQLVQICGPLKL